MESNWESINWTSRLRSIDFPHYVKPLNRECTASPTDAAGQPHALGDTRSIPHTKYKNQLKLEWINVRDKTTKLFEENRLFLPLFNFGTNFYDLY